MPWHFENAVAGSIAGLTAVVALHPLDVVRTRFQVSGGHGATVPKYRNTANALLLIARNEGLRGLYAGLYPAVLGSSLSWGMFFYTYNNLKFWNRRWSENYAEMISAAEAGALVCFATNPFWLVKTRLQLQSPGYGLQKPYAGFADALRSIVKNEGWRALYKGLGPSLVLVTHGTYQFAFYEVGREQAIKLRSSFQFAAYEDGQKFVVELRNSCSSDDKDKEACLKPMDYAVLGGLSKVFATVFTYPYQVIRARIQQRPTIDGKTNYLSVLEASREIARHERLAGFYRGIGVNFLKNVPAASITFLVYETILKMLS